MKHTEIIQVLGQVDTQQVANTFGDFIRGSIRNTFIDLMATEVEALCVRVVTVNEGEEVEMIEGREGVLRGNVTMKEGSDLVRYDDGFSDWASALPLPWWPAPRPPRVFASPEKAFMDVLGIKTIGKTNGVENFPFFWKLSTCLRAAGCAV
jgi:hypothetical protein